MKLILGIVFALFSPLKAEDTAAFDLATNVICGEGGNDEVLAVLWGHLINNRMRLLPGARRDKIQKVLLEDGQFNGRCKLKKIPDFVPWVAKALLTGAINDFGRPVWFTDNVRWATEKKTAEKWLKRMKWKSPPTWLRSVRKAGEVNGVVFFEKM